MAETELASESPERHAVSLAVDYFEEIRTTVPVSSETLKVEQRRKVHKAADKLFGCVSELAGITAEIRHQLEKRETEMDELKAKLAIMEYELKKTKECASEIMRGKDKADVSANDNASAGIKPTYAAAMKKPTYAILIEPTNGKSSDENPVDKRLNIESIKNARNGGVIVRCTNKQDIKKIELSLATKTELKGKEMKKGRPRILLPNIEEDTENESITKILFDQNEHISARYETLDLFQKESNVQSRVPKQKKHQQQKCNLRNRG